MRDEVEPLTSSRFHRLGVLEHLVLVVVEELDDRSLFLRAGRVLLLLLGGLQVSMNEGAGMTECKDLALRKSDHDQLLVVAVQQHLLFDELLKGAGPLASL